MKHTIALGLWSVLFLVSGPVVAEKPTRKEKDSFSYKQEVFLKFNLKPGDQYRFSSVVKQHIVQEAMGQQITTTQDIATDYIYDVKSVEEGVTTINVTFSAVKMDTDVAGMQQLSYDSANPDAGTNELKVMSNLIGKSFLMYINEEGSVEKVEGLAEIIGGVEGPQSELLKQSFGDSSMIQNMSQITNIYPNQKVNIGDTWVRTFSGPIAGMMQSEATSNFALSQVTGDVAVLEVDGQMKFSKLAGGGGNPMLQGAEFNLNGTQQGTMEVDIASGLPVQTKLKQDISGSLEIQGMQIPMSIVSDITITGQKL